MDILPQNVEEIRDIVYGNVKGRPLRLNIARPKLPPKKPMPIIVYIHGGAWMMGDYKGPENYPFAAKGYFTVNIEYRLSDEAIFPAQIHDCKAAIRWLRAHAEEYGIDPDRIGVWGHSAGGHLAALLGTSHDITEMEGDEGSEGFSSSVQAVVDLCGATDLFQLDLDATEKLVGGPLNERTELVKMANPVTYVTPDDPPFLIIHGDKDPHVPLIHSELLYNALRKANVEATFIIVKNGDHGFHPSPKEAKAEPNLDEIHNIISNFFDKHLKAFDKGKRKNL